MQATERPRRRLAISRALFGALIAFALCSPALAAFQYTLPPAGTDVSNDWDGSTPELVIATAMPSSAAFVGEVQFTDGKFLRIAHSSLFSLHVDVTFHAPGMAGLFEPIFIPFNESLQLLRADGSTFASAPKNGSVGYFDDNGPYSFGWDFHPLDELRIHGLRWIITPDLAAGATLPAVVDLELSMWGEFPIVVAPEPTAFTLALAGLACVGMFSRSGSAQESRPAWRRSS